MADTMTVLGKFQFDTTGFKTLSQLSNSAGNSINKLEKKTKVLGKTSKATSKKLNKMLDDYKKRTEKSTSATGSMIKKIGALAAGFATVSTVFDSFNLASDMTEIQNKLNVVFGKMSGDADKWAENYADTLGFSVMKTKESMGDIQNLFTGFGMDRETSFGMTKQIVTLANDLDSFNNLSSRGIDVQKTMISALMGETEAAKTLGASILETNLQVASADLGLGKYSAKMSEATKIKIRYHAIEMQSKDAIGDVARNLDTEVAKRRMLSKEIEKQKIALGNSLMPVWEKGLVVTTQLVAGLGSITETFKSVYAWTQKNSIGALAFKGAVVALTTAYVTYKTVALAALAITKSRDLWIATKTLPAYFMQNLAILKTTASLAIQKTAIIATSVATKAMTAAQWALNLALNANPVGLVIAGVAALGGALYFAYKKSEPFRKFIDSMIEKGKKLFSLMMKLPGFKTIKNIFSSDDEQTGNSKTETAINNVQVKEKLASGTNYTKGGLTLVGEKGAELVEMPQGAKVLNNNKTENLFKTLNGTTNNDNKIFTRNENSNISRVFNDNKAKTVSNVSNSSNKSFVVQGDTITLNVSVNSANGDDITQKIKDVLEQHVERKRSRMVAMYKGV